MFTGIVEEVGCVRTVVQGDGHARLEVEGPLVASDAAIGDSIAVSGCCLTVTALLGEGRPTGFSADLMAETLRVTALGDLAEGDPVNLERAMSASDRFGGHLIQGHVDAVGEVVSLDEQPGTLFVTVTAPGEVAPYLVPKGSITVAGVSLTVVDVAHGTGESATFRVGLIPHTRDVTTLGSLREGDRVNLEADVIAKYVRELLAGGASTPYRGPQGRTET